MRALFVADGPFSRSAKLKSNANLKVSGIEGKNATAAMEPFVIEHFDNVQLYGLVAKLLGFKPAKTNGTEGFWDDYVDW
jgi:hypothetical protein